MQQPKRVDVSPRPGDEPPLAVLPVASTEESDVELVLALLRGAPDAPAVLFDRYAPHLRRVLVRMVGYGDPERSDLLHDVFIRALENIKDLKNPRALRAWLTRIAVFTAQEWIRRRRRIGPPTPPEAADLFEAVAATSPEAVEAVRAFYGVLERLNVEERTVFVLRFVERMNLTEVAEACDVSLSTARRRIARAEDRFQTLLADHPALLERWKDGRA